MKKYVAFAAGMLTASFALQAQMEKTAGTSFQFFTTEAGSNMKVLAADQMNGPTVAGKPFSATEERHTLQILGDGTRIEKTETDRLFRDNQGRTRTERPDGTVIVHDPLLGVTTESNTNGKSSKVMLVQRRETTQISRDLTKITTELEQQRALMASKASIEKQAAEERAAMSAKAGKAPPSAVEEDLGSSSVNGAIAQGTRQTTVIEAGQIGNDRPIRIVSERWYSNELQMLVKSSNSDPRFGETSYQLTNVSMAVPDPALFQVPAERRLGGQ